MSEEKEEKFAVYCEAEKHNQPLYLSGLTFARLLEDVIVPLESSEPFFVDGAPLTKEMVRAGLGRAPGTVTFSAEQTCEARGCRISHRRPRLSPQPLQAEPRRRARRVASTRRIVS